MATVPLSGTSIRLLKNVPFSNDYKHTRWFDTKQEQTSYFTAKPVVHSLNQANFQRIEGKHFISVDRSIDDLWGTNYLMFQNSEYNSKWFYAFVTKLEYKNKQTTYVHFQIDVFQTWKFDMTFKPSYVIREHRRLWNSDGTPVINTIDEGLAYGTEYDTVSVQNIQPTGGYKWLVIITKEPMHNGSPNQIVPTVIGTPTPLNVYLVPFMDNNTVPRIVDTNNNGGILSKPTDVLKGLYTDTNAVNNVVSIYISDFVGIPVNISDGDLMTIPSTSGKITIQQISDGGTAYFNCLWVEEILDFGTEVKTLGSKYSGYKTVKESKLLMHPYVQLTLDDFKGNRMNYKPEYIGINSISLLIKGSLGHSNKTSYGIIDYNFNSTNTSLQNVISDEFALINNEPNDVPVLSDLLSAYIQGNRNSLINQKQTIQWNGTMNAIGSVVSGVGSATGKVPNPIGMVQAGVSLAQGIGNTVLEIQGMQAKAQDIANTPSQMAKMGSNTSYTIGNNFNGVFVIKKQIKDEYIVKLSNFFNMFGYKTNEVKIPNMHTRQNWNYVQTSSCNITGNFNNEDLNELKAIFDNGICLWHTDDVGNYSLENEVI